MSNPKTDQLLDEINTNERLIRRLMKRDKPLIVSIICDGEVLLTRRRDWMMNEGASPDAELFVDIMVNRLQWEVQRLKMELSESLKQKT